MENIELNEKQKENLLEMCKVLFPEYNDQSLGGTGPISFHHDNLYPGMLFGFKSNGEDGDSYDHTSLFIHWFEFCMTHLAKKLLDPNDLMYYQTTGYFSYEHPIDYFYVKFKQLK